ncbi:MAG: type II toxin-antitoxin system VapC family toxin [Gemmatimonadetes bacterium]|nr:type II toxin-antitoxin system VapC family toxin [Gemmatimonadota bacterium]NNM04868.1 type II toxin-antitoxin system VapC family toxin [Gemmatimonadota bacterium]
MRIVADTSVIIAVISGESSRARLIEMTQGADLLAPPSLHWELGNALASQLRRGRLQLSAGEALLRAYQKIPIQFVEVSLAAALELAEALGIYAYDAYMIACAQKYRIPLVTLDQGLARAGVSAGVEVMEVA